MKKAYFFINGFLHQKYNEYEDQSFLNINGNVYEVENYGVRKSFDKCKSSAIWDISTGILGEINITPNTYIAIFEIELTEEDYDSIDESCAIADFDVWDYIISNKERLIYSAMFDENKNTIENFISDNKLMLGKK